MLLIDRLTDKLPITRQLFGEARMMKVHPDVLSLASHLSQDGTKLKHAAPYIFWPAGETWLEWRDDRGSVAFYFEGEREDHGERGVQFGRGTLIAWDRSEAEPTVIPLRFDMPGYAVSYFNPGQEAARLASRAHDRSLQALMAQGGKPMTMEQQINLQAAAENLRPVVFAILALINSPKVIKSVEVRQDKLNRSRLKRGKYPFHPHHEVRLNVDKREIMTTAGHGDGSHRALHFVRAHLRFRLGQYELVRPHWRGDPEVGIIDTEYAVDRERSRWK